MNNKKEKLGGGRTYKYMYFIHLYIGAYKMKSNNLMFYSKVLEQNRRVFKIPVYQRNYDWTNKQCEKLYDDIIEAKIRKENHFIGIIVYEYNRLSSDLEEVLVIDGQQRITTIYILLKALYDAAKKLNNNFIASDIEEVLFNRNCEEKYKVKLKPIESDNYQLQFLLNDRFNDMDRESNLYKAYKIFESRITRSIKSGLELNDILIGIKNLEVVEIILDKHTGDDPQRIFESINSTGLELSLGDLVRNYLLMNINNQEWLYKNYWKAIEKNVEYKNLEDFLINYLNYKVKESVTLKNAYDVYKNYFKASGLSNEEELVELLKVSKYYGAFIGAHIYNNTNIQYYLNSFYSIKQTTILPLLFNLLADYENGYISEAELCDVLKYLLTYLIRIITCENNKSLNKLFKSMYIMIMKDTKENYKDKFITFLNSRLSSERMPTDQEFREALIYKPLYKKYICRFILSEIENSSKEQINTNGLTIEHILPQKSNASNWKKELGSSYERIYEIYLHTLGNLTFSGYNYELGIKSFRQKKDLINNVSRIKLLNEDILKVDVWNEEAILNRANNLADKIIALYPYQEGKYSYKHEDTINATCFDLSENFDCSYTKPKGFELVGDYYKTGHNWKDLLHEFMKLAFELDSSSLYEMANENTISGRSRVYISNRDNVQKMHTPAEIYKTNLSANSIRNVIKTIIEKIEFDLEDCRIYLEL